MAEGKTTGELKAEPLTTSQLDRWLAGKMPRRILMLPYGGPIPSKASPLGVDIDGQWFDDDTDYFDGHKALLATRERLTDWHHDMDPTFAMKGAILGTSIFDDKAETVTIDGSDYTGRWADYWANAGEKRRDLVAALERRSVPLYASSQAAYSRIAKSGHIDVWPVIRNTISTSPQNTYAVVPPLKALLDFPSLDEIPADALKALLVGLDASTAELLLGSTDAAVHASAPSGSAEVKAGRVLSRQTIADLERVIDLAEHELPALLRALVARGRPQETP